MIRIILFSILVLTISCKDAKSPQVDGSSLTGREKVLFDVTQAGSVSQDDGNYLKKDVVDINATIKGKGLSVAPHEIMQLYAGVNQETIREGRQTLDMSNVDLAHGWIETTLVHDFMLDDAVKARKIIMTFEPDGEKQYKVYSILEQYQCYPDRGHQDWSPKFCN